MVFPYICWVHYFHALSFSPSSCIQLYFSNLQCWLVVLLLQLSQMPAKPVMTICLSSTDAKQMQMWQQRKSRLQLHHGWMWWAVMMWRSCWLNLSMPQWICQIHSEFAKLTVNLSISLWVWQIHCASYQPMAQIVAFYCDIEKQQSFFCACRLPNCPLGTCIVKN